MRAYCRPCDEVVEASGAWPGRCGACDAPVEEHPLADVLGERPRLLLVGINPGIKTVRDGLHFANPRNVFWRALHAGGLMPEPWGPREQAKLVDVGIGLTNVVTRATPGSNDVTREDVARGRQRLERLVRDVRPEWLAFVGKEAYRMAAGERAPTFGEQAPLWGAQVFVLPSTSPANAGIPPEEKARWFGELRKAMERPHPSGAGTHSA